VHAPRYLVGFGGCDGVWAGSWRGEVDDDCDGAGVGPGFVVATGDVPVAVPLVGCVNTPDWFAG